LFPVRSDTKQQLTDYILGIHSAAFKNQADKDKLRRTINVLADGFDERLAKARSRAAHGSSRVVSDASGGASAAAAAAAASGTS
jgi:hypothetical protein